MQSFKSIVFNLDNWMMLSGRHSKLFPPRYKLSKEDKQPNVLGIDWRWQSLKSNNVKYSGLWNMSFGIVESWFPEIDWRFQSLRSNISEEQILSSDGLKESYFHISSDGLKGHSTRFLQSLKFNCASLDLITQFKDKSFNCVTFLIIKKKGMSKSQNIWLLELFRY